MNTIWKLTIAQLRMYVRDRQSVFFAMFFPLLFMLALGFMVTDSDIDPIQVSVVNESTAGDELVEALNNQALLTVNEESEDIAREALREGNRRLVVIIPESFSVATVTSQSLTILVDSAKPQEAQQA